MSKPGNGMCPVCHVVPRQAGGGYCVGCMNALAKQYYHAKKGNTSTKTLGTWQRPPLSQRKPPTDWRAVLAEADAGSYTPGASAPGGRGG